MNLRTYYKSLLTLALAIVLPLAAGVFSPVQAQPIGQPDVASEIDQAPMFTFGVRGLLNLSDASGPDLYDLERRSRFGAGAFATLRVLPFLSIQPEVLYVPRAVNISSENVSGPIRGATLEMAYLDVPLLFKLYPGKLGRTNPYVYAGPFYSKQLSGDVVFDQQIEAAGLSDELHSSDYGLVFGAGLERYVSGLVTSFDVRYLIGSSTLFDNENRPDLYNRGLMFSLGIGI